MPLQKILCKMILQRIFIFSPKKNIYRAFLLKEEDSIKTFGHLNPSPENVFSPPKRPDNNLSKYKSWREYSGNILLP